MTYKIKLGTIVFLVSVELTTSYSQTVRLMVYEKVSLHSFLCIPCFNNLSSRQVAYSLAAAHLKTYASFKTVHKKQAQGNFSKHFQFSLRHLYSTYHTTHCGQYQTTPALELDVLSKPGNTDNLIRQASCVGNKYIFVNLSEIK